MVAAKPGFDPVQPVMSRPCASASTKTRVPRIADCVTANCTNLFDVSYEMLLQALERYFAHAKESDAQLGAVADATIALMVRVLTPLGGLLTTLAVASG